ncbi:MAG: hypothetical protein J6K71_00185, partial [Clostridia bacterium]|nr:hypothetical protein [Clostridia bacterium]
VRSPDGPPKLNNKSTKGGFFYLNGPFDLQGPPKMPTEATRSGFLGSGAKLETGLFCEKQKAKWSFFAKPSGVRSPDGPPNSKAYPPCFFSTALQNSSAKKFCCLPTMGRGLGVLPPKTLCVAYAPHHKLPAGGQFIQTRPFCSTCTKFFCCAKNVEKTKKVVFFV